MAERLADVETMIEFVKRYTPCINGETTMECVERSIRNAPTVDAKLVVHAHWKQDWAGLYYCSNCADNAIPHLRKKKYCPDCGAQMDELNKK